MLVIIFQGTGFSLARWWASVMGFFRLPIGQNPSLKKTYRAEYVTTGGTQEEEQLYLKPT